MASVLSLRPQSPFKRSFSDNPYLRSCSPLKDTTNGVLQVITSRNASACSIHTLGATTPVAWLSGGENTPPPLTSRSLLDLGLERDRHGAQAGCLDDAPRKRSCGTNRHTSLHPSTAGPSPPFPKKRKEPSRVSRPRGDHVDPIMHMDTDIHDHDHDHDEIYDLYDAIHVPLPEGRHSDNIYEQPCAELEAPVTVEVPPPAFRRWMSTLRRRHMSRQKWPSFRTGLEADGDMDLDMLEAPPSSYQAPRSSYQYSESLTSSMGCVTGVQSASVTQASGSIAPAQSVDGHPQPKGRYGKRSSTFSDVRKSIDSNAGSLGPILDENAWMRSVERRKIIEEIIASEESYIGDLKVLINVSDSIVHQ